MKHLLLLLLLTTPLHAQTAAERWEAYSAQTYEECRAVLAAEGDDDTAIMLREVLRQNDKIATLRKDVDELKARVKAAPQAPQGGYSSQPQPVQPAPYCPPQQPSLRRSDPGFIK